MHPSYAGVQLSASVIAFCCMPEPLPTSVVTQAETTQDERTMGTLAHVLQLVGGWIAPLIIFLVKRDSRFVSFHALQVLLLQGFYVLFVMRILCLRHRRFCASS